MKPLDFHPRAEAEYLDAVEYYERQRPGLGLEFQEQIELAAKEIQEAPRRYAVYEEEEDVRQYVVKRFPFSVIYAELDDRIWIAAVAHHKRKPGYWAGRKPN